MERIEGPTPNKGAYSECYWLNDDRVEVSKDEATQVIIKEFLSDGTLIHTTYGEIGEQNDQ